MKRSSKIAVGIVASLGLGLAVASAYAHPEHMGRGMGPGGMGGMKQGANCDHKMMGQQLMTSEERTTLREKMHSAATPEERQKLAEATRTEMQKRAKEKGITLPEHRGPGAGFGPNTGPGAGPHTH
jgi:Spy/CpxP family protein refolding chaperone